MAAQPRPSGALNGAGRRRKAWGAPKRPSPVLKSKFKSKLEERVAGQIEAAGLVANYETLKVPYEVPSRKARYTPDFPLTDTLVVETKGRFRSAAERQKMVLVRDQHPELDIRLLFQNAALPIYKGSPTTHGKWASDNGFVWADKGIMPTDWLETAKQEGTT